MVDPLANLVDDRKINDDLYSFIQRMSQRKLGGPVMPRAHAKLMWEGLIEMAFRYALRTGQFRFPKGYGSLYLRRLSQTRKKLPSGEWIELTGDRAILRYNEGLMVRELLGKPPKYDRKRARKELTGTKSTSAAV